MRAGRRWMVAGLVALATGGATAAATPPAHALGMGQGVDLLAQRGFGTPSNGYSWGMAWFKGKLYVGTGRRVACVEAWTRAFFLPLLQPYSTNPAANVPCPSDPYDMNLRAEIWQFTPRTNSWKRVYRAPLQKNPAVKGGHIARDIAYRGMAVRKDDSGRETLYVAGVSANEYVPALKRTAPPRLLHTSDGRHFAASTPSANFKVTTLTGTQSPMGFRSMEFIGDRMYMTASTGLTGDGAVVQVKGATSKHMTLKQVSPKDVAVFEIETYRHHLFMGTGDDKRGYGVYRSRYSAPREDGWQPLITGGAGRGVRLTSVVSMHAFKGRLYVGSSGWTNEERTLPTTEVIRIGPTGSWDVVVGNTRVDNGNVKFPISGLGDGWGSNFTAHPWRMTSQNGVLYAGTNDFSSTLINQGYPLIQTLLSSGYGFDIWASCDGQYWFPVTRNAFDGNPFDFGARTMVPTPYGIAVGSADHALGTSVWMDRRNACGSGIKTAPKGKRTRSVHGLMADAQHDGTVVSWERGQAGSHYRVLRAELPEVNVSLQGPAALPSGFTFDDDAPKVVPPGTPGSESVNLVAMGSFTDVGQTMSAHFVDTTREAGKHYAYRVVSVDGKGHETGSTGVQTTPSQTPAPTFASVASQVAHATGTTTAHAASGPAGIAALERAARGNAQLTDLVSRLRRMQQYAQLAGGR